MKNSQEVFESHMRAVDTLEPSKVAEDYTDDAIFITPEKTYKGKQAIFDFYKEFLPNFDGFKFKIIKQEVHDNVVYFVWNGKNTHLDIQLATDTYIIDNGKIKQHTFAAINN
ncbi:nuclear transport factor 2 family protein [Aquimarina sp. MMG015]|uniref:nuclear transport factor 2 family protein n=1 Tax=Aquimarina TaxID=290174 RepID=UPI0004183C47|nr:MULTISPECIES: nuclear transport factor 2 family protein [Aquimarina]AXT55232.1 nuclear transport factor 2 family protein [Aquimarina sp. AD1]MBQ4802193.1 nuclear transport factor 2 family protein [Aquimarina sp. MMG015]RKN10677.1 nuclear transport factor 2 family protein [Aquimarina sp. AD1]